MVAEIASAGKVNVCLLAALMFWMLPLLPARTRDGTLPVPADSTTAALAEADHVAAELHAAAAGHVLQRQAPARLSPPSVTAAGEPPKSSVELAVTAMLVLGKLTGAR